MTGECVTACVGGWVGRGGVEGVRGGGGGGEGGGGVGTGWTVSQRRWWGREGGGLYAL